MTSLLEQVKSEAQKSAREAAKGKLKNLFQKRIDLQQSVAGIEQEIVDLLVSVGEDEAGVRELLKADTLAEKE